MELVVGKKYKTVGGHDAICVYERSDARYPMIAVVVKEESEIPLSYTKDGKFSIGGPHGNDLVEIPEPIPEGVCFRDKANNFHRTSDGHVLLRRGCALSAALSFDYDKWLPRASEFPTYDSVFSRKPLSITEFDTAPYVRVNGEIFCICDSCHESKRVSLVNYKSGIRLMSTQDLADANAEITHDIGETWRNCWE